MRNFVGTSQPEYSDIFVDDGLIPGGGAPKKRNVHKDVLADEIERCCAALTAEQKQAGIKAYSLPARRSEQKAKKRHKGPQKYNEPKVRR